MWIFGLLVACGGPADKAGGSDDTDRRPEETDPGPVDTDGPDTPPVDTDVPYVEPGDDSDTQRETVDLPPPDLGAGFVDLTAALYATWSRDVFPGDRIDVHEPDLTHASFVDLDGDGWSEVVVFGTGAAPDAPRLPQALRYDRVAEALVFDPALTASVIGLDPQTAGFADLDGDGDADAIPGGWEDDPIEALGDGTFARDPSRRWPAYGPGLMSAAIVDLDADGSPDIVRSATGCRPDAVSWEAMVRVGAFRWRLHTGLLAAAPPANPYAMGAGWLGGQLVLMGLGLACSQADEAPGFFITTREDAEGYPVFEGTDITPQGGPYKLRVQVAGGPVTRVNPMGASLGDLDGDGDVDLVITSVHRDLLVFLDDGSLPLRDVTGAPPAELPPKLPDASGGPYEALKPWGVATLDVDRDGVNDLVFVNGDDHSDWIQDTPGGHRPAVMINRRSAWVEAGEAAHLGLPWNGRSTAVGDLDHDGLPDLAFGGNGEPPRVYLNRASGERPGLALRLRGTTSGGPASGAVARVFDDGLATDAVVA
ncbi:MAG TPA: VCBS repeat-containing protein, partial [Myxococcota bacterium]|nr:VCBS repeat-containing protein [Myxococcota bacterium]